MNHIQESLVNWIEERSTGTPEMKLKTAGIFRALDEICDTHNVSKEKVSYAVHWVELTKKDLTTEMAYDLTFTLEDGSEVGLFLRLNAEEKIYDINYRNPEMPYAETIIH